MANTASASAITTRPGPGATKSTTPTARITVPTTVTAIRRSSLTGSFTSASMPSTPPVPPRATGSEREGGGEQADRWGVGLTGLRRGVADAADLVPFGHPAHFLLVD